MAKRPNKAEREYMGLVADMGCVICQMPAEIHHITTGVGMGQRASNYDVIPLCPAHHRQGSDAIHAGKRSWEEKFGTELHFLDLVKEAMGDLGK